MQRALYGRGGHGSLVRRLGRKTADILGQMAHRAGVGGSEAELEPELRAELASLYRPHNEHMVDLLRCGRVARESMLQNLLEGWQ
jgi:hypothetical protein